ncbi:MAG: glycosyltransferase family 39 protein, partial [Pseudomonadota bacterium]
QLKPLSGIGLMVLITLPWLVYVLLNGGSAYWADLMGGDLFRQLISGEDYPTALPGYYFVTYSLYMWPFGLVAVIGGTYAIRRMHTDPRLLFCLAWYLPFWLILELYPMKLPHFVFPAYPALLLLGGWFLSQVPSEIDKPRWWQSLVHGLTGFGVIFVTLGFAVITIVVPVYIAADFTFWSIPMVLLLVMACWFGLGYGLELSPVQRVAVAMVTATAAYGLMFALILPSIDQIWVSRQIADRFNEQKVCEDAVLASVTYHEPSLVFLTGTKTLLAGPGSAADHLLSDPECAMAAVPDEDAPAFRTALTAAGATAESGELISGFNYSRGKQIAVRLYRINGS